MLQRRKVYSSPELYQQVFSESDVITASIDSDEDNTKGLSSTWIGGFSQ